MAKVLKTTGALLGLVFLSACASGMEAQDFTDTGPVFDPQVFFTGDTQAWGVIETSSGTPDKLFTSTDHGSRDQDGNLILVQKFSFADGTRKERDWTLHRIDEHHFEGTANDVEGVAMGEAYGSTLHWQYVLELDPGNTLKDVDMDQWMYLQPDGSVLNRAGIRKAGITVAQVTERFTRVVADKVSPPKPGPVVRSGKKRIHHSRKNSR